MDEVLRLTKFNSFWQLSDVYEEERSCRNCKFFIRVKGDDNDIKQRGFCILGMHQGDFSLYLSSTYARRCTSFVFDKEKAHIAKLEEQLHQKWRDTMFRVYDKRTKEYKSVKPLFERFGIDEIRLHDERIVNALYQIFITRHRNEFFEIRAKRNKISISQEEYAKVLTTITNFFAKHLLGNEE